MFRIWVYKVCKLVFLAGVLLALTGLSFTWRMYAKEITDPTRPIFCFDEEGTCTGRGRHLSNIIFQEYNDKGESIQYNWILSYDPEQGQGSADLNQLIYGVVPEGYKEKFPAKKLKLNTYYGIEFQNFFKIYQKDGKYKIEILNPVLDKGSFEKAFPKARE